MMQYLSMFALVFLFAACSSAKSTVIGSPTQGTVCEINVDFNRETGPVTHKASGILHSFHTQEPPDDLVLPLKLKAFRGRANENYLLLPGFYDRLRRIGVRHIQVVISDSYGYPNMFYSWPGDKGDWAPWENTVESVVKACQKQNMEVEYDIWNEPNHSYFWKKDRATWFETWKRGYVKVRSLQKNAVIVGPSITHYDPDFLREFLIYARGNSCLPDILSWHELGTAGGETIPDHERKARDLLKSLDVDIRRISLHEIIPQNRQFSPGTAVCYFANIEKTDVESACHSCWEDVKGNNGENRSLDGMLTHDTKKPRSIWWAYKYYGDMEGSLYDLSVMEAKPRFRVNGLASYDPVAGDGRILLGSYEKERTLDICLNISGITVSHSLFRMDRIRTRAFRIPDTQTKPLEAPLLILDNTIAVPGKDLVLHLPQLAPGEVISMEWRRNHE
jgi:hypothetical protein